METQNLIKSTNSATIYYIGEGEADLSYICANLGIFPHADLLHILPSICKNDIYSLKTILLYTVNYPHHHEHMLSHLLRSLDDVIYLVKRCRPMPLNLFESLITYPFISRLILRSNICWYIPMIKYCTIDVLHHLISEYDAYFPLVLSKLYEKNRKQDAKNLVKKQLACNNTYIINIELDVIFVSLKYNDYLNAIPKDIILVIGFYLDVYRIYEY